MTDQKDREQIAELRKVLKEYCVFPHAAALKLVELGYIRQSEPPVDKAVGFWKSERGINGDSWADEMVRCMETLSKDVILRNKGKEDNPAEAHEITMNEFADLVEFCSRGHLVVEVRHPEADGERPLSQLHSNAVQTYTNRGQMQRQLLE